MSPDPVTWTALDRSTYAPANRAGDPFYVEPPSVLRASRSATIAGGAAKAERTPAAGTRSP